MDEFLKIQWRATDLSSFDPQSPFITEESAADSMIFRHLENKKLLRAPPKKSTKQIFEEEISIAGESFYYPTIQKSTLNTIEHERCLKALKLLQSGKKPQMYTHLERNNVELYQQLKPKINSEHLLYNSFALKKWELDKIRLKCLKTTNLFYGKKSWERKIRQVFNLPQYYKECNSFILNLDENQSCIDFKCVQNVLEMGMVGKFSSPNLNTKCILKCTTFPETETQFASKLTVSKDENITSLLQKHNEIDVLISASGLKCIVDNADLKRKWMIPFIVKTTEMAQEDGTIRTKRVAFIDKPLPNTHISKLDLLEMSYKTLVRTNLCNYEAFRYPTQESPIEIADDAEGMNEPPPRKMFMGRFKGNMLHNVNYRIWNVKKTDSQCNLMKTKSRPVEINVLVRSKLDACEITDNQALLPVIVKPKLERQLKFGVNVPTKSELAREWTSLFFRPFSNLYRARLSSATSEVVQIEHCTAQKVITEAQNHYEYRPNLGLCRLQKVFEEITKLDSDGNYLLQHLPKHEAFVSIFRECDKSLPDAFDLHEDYRHTEISEFPNDWIPIDVNYLLPSFEAHKRLPGMFTPYEKRKDFYMVKKKGKKKKKKAASPK